MKTFKQFLAEAKKNPHALPVRNGEFRPGGGGTRWEEPGERYNPVGLDVSAGRGGDGSYWKQKLRAKKKKNAKR